MKFKKMFKFVKSKFKILTSVVLLGRLNMSRGILAGEYDEENMGRGNIYCIVLLKLSAIVIFLDFHSTKQGLLLADSWSVT